jgi:DNA polymerase
MVVCDYSSIEARVLAWLAHDEDLLAVFRNGEDVYVNFGQRVWPATMLDGAEEPEDSPAYKAFKKRRFVAKTCVLGLGYGASWPVLETVLRTGSMGASVIIDEETARGIGVERAYVLENLRAMKERYKKDTENGAGRWEALVAPLRRDASLLWHYGACMRLVEIYRGERWAVAAFWQAMEPRRLMTHPDVGHITGTFTDTAPMAAPMAMQLTLPGGPPLVFPQIKVKRRGADFVQAGVPMSTYGAKLVENVTQAVARNLLRDAWIAAYQAGLHVAMTVHDEIVCIEREEGADQAAEMLTRIMSTPPAWAVGLPVDAEASVVDCYAQK